MMIRSFLLQTILSVSPTVLVYAMVPYVSQSIGHGIFLAGLIFLAIKLGQILGAFVAAKAVLRYPPHQIAAISEVASVGTSVGLYATFEWGSAIAVILLFLVKGILSGAVTNTRVVWLKQVPNESEARRIVVLVKTLIQASYGAAGLLILVVPEKHDLVGLALLADGLTSVVGSILFYRLKTLGVGNLQSPPSARWDLFPFRARRVQVLLMIDVLLAIALGGTNILLVKYGQLYLKEWGGYPAALIVYSGLFLLGGLVAQYDLRDTARTVRILRYLAPICVVAGFIALLVASPSIWGPLLGMVGLSAIFIGYPIFLLEIEALWFRFCTPLEAGKVFAHRTLWISLISAAGEVCYGAIGADLMLRLAPAAISAVLMYGLAIRMQIQTRQSSHSIGHSTGH